MSALDARTARMMRASDAAAPSDAPAVYVGMDPTAPSLHIGNLLQLNTLLRFRRRGIRTVALLGGATGMIGDPSGRSTERQLIDDTNVLQQNTDAIAASVRRIMAQGDGPETTLVNNVDWLGPSSMSALDFLRDVGKHFSVPAMLTRDSVRSRLDAGGGISFTEFSYQLLQAYDFYTLYRKYDVALQIGGSDQWGNIVSGIDYVRRRVARDSASRTAAAAATDDNNVVSGLTIPLLLAADGSKLGKSAGNATIWLDPSLTSPFEFFQYFVQLSDADAATLLPKFSLLPIDAVVEVLAEHDHDRSKRRAQVELARAVCTLVHGAQATEAVEHATSILFPSDATAVLTSSVDLSVLRQVLATLPHTVITRAELFAKPIVTLLVDSKACDSKSAARKLIAGGGCYVGGRRVDDGTASLRESDLLRDHSDEKFCVLRTGKKTYRILRVVPTPKHE